jgi:hypothetical protein
MNNKRHLMLRDQFTVALAAAFGSAPLFAQTNSESTNAPLKLFPPYGELPPTFWEQNASSISLAGLGLVVLMALGLWLFFRPKSKNVIPPEAQAREALEKLRQQPENGAVLSCVSQAVRNYFSAAFKLSPGELTTTEFGREISDNEEIGEELATATANFLRDCDARKFSPTAGPAKLDAADRGLNLIEQAEQRRAQLRQPAKMHTQEPRA